MINTAYDKYRQSSVQTSNPGQLVIMLYDGAIRFVKTAVEGLRTNNYDLANTNFGKAQGIVNELIASLDPAYDLSKNLAALYEYTNHLLIQANIKKNAAPAEEALGYLVELRETWYQANKTAVQQHG